VLYFEFRGFKQVKSGNRQNIHRFVRLDLEKLLFGDHPVCLLRESGTVGRKPSKREEFFFEDEDQARNAAVEFVREVQTRGFVLTGPDPWFDEVLVRANSGLDQPEESGPPETPLPVEPLLETKADSEPVLEVVEEPASRPEPLPGPKLGFQDVPLPSGIAPGVIDPDPYLEPAPSFESDPVEYVPEPPPDYEIPYFDYDEELQHHGEPPPIPDYEPEPPPDLDYSAPEVQFPDPVEEMDTTYLPLLDEVKAPPVQTQPPHGNTGDVYDFQVPAPLSRAQDFLQVHTSNHLPVLLEKMARELALKPLHPRENELILVQSLGMSRWVTLELARQHGISASHEMPFPATFFEELSAKVLDEATPQENPFSDRQLLTWLIFRMLPECLREPLFSPLAGYLNHDPGGRKRYQLATRVAACLDDYQVYRPDFPTAWEALKEAGPDSPHRDWQAELWRRLVKQAGTQTRLARFARLLRTLAKNDNLEAVLPRRISVFGLSNLPPLFIHLLGALARHIPVSVYFVSPTWHYWGDIQSQREQARMLRRFRRNRDQPRHMEKGNALLASFGGQGRDFFKLLEDADTSGAAWHTLDFIVPHYDSMLHALQADVLKLVDRTARAQHDPFGVNPDDRSIQIHSCHSPMREMEVLRDQLLESFAADPELKPHEVLVMVPDIRVYTPYIQAVFGVEHSGSPRLPFSLADRSLSQENPLTAAFLRTLQVARGRLGSTEVLELLEEPAVRRRFEIDEEDLSAIRVWIEETRIRWARDGAQRRSDFDLPPLDANSWMAGLNRLLMGYATGAVDELVSGVLPYGEDTAGHVNLLGSTITFAETLFRFVRPLRRSHPLATWSRILTDLINVFFTPNGLEEEEALQMLRDAARGLETAQLVAAMDEPVGLPVVRDHLERMFADDGLAAGFISGRITFCALKPMRTIPFKVVCIGGLNNGDFPRQSGVTSFNLIGAAPRVGDRSPREDDRYLFLETVLAAGNRLILSYLGRSITDNSDMVPSVVVNELLDYLDGAYYCPDGVAARDFVVTEHPLQAFSQNYYNGSDPRLFSYCLENYHAAGIQSGLEARPFLEGRLEAEEGPLALEIEKLIAFWAEPCRFFCQRILHLYLPQKGDAPDEAEPFSLSGLDRYKLHDLILERRFRFGQADEQAVVDASGLAPPGELGVATYIREQENLDPLFAELESWEQGRTELFELVGSDWRMSGFLDGLGRELRLQYRPGMIRPKDLVSGWISHLVLNVLSGQGLVATPSRSLLIGLGKAKNGPRPVLRTSFQPVANALEILDQLVAGYRLGCCAPPPLFTRTSHTYAKARWDRENKGSRSQPMDQAHRIWSGGKYPGPVLPESLDPYVRLCFRGKEPLREEEEAFKHQAVSLWYPLFKSTREEQS